MVTRTFTVAVENLTEHATFTFGGEWFETGGWQGERVATIKDRAMLVFENKVFLRGVSGYVYYQNANRSLFLLLVFSCPVTSAAGFTARASSVLQDCQALFNNLPDVSRTYKSLRRAEGCAWETKHLDDTDATVRCVVLSKNAADRIPEDFARNLNQAKICRSALNEVSHTVPEQSPWLLERRVIIEIDNRSTQTFKFDGDWFETGRWWSHPVALLKPGLSQLEFVNAEGLKGLNGIAWYVNDSTFDKYFSMVFSNPVTSSASFGAWAGQPPAELQKELYANEHFITTQTGVQAPAHRGCAWNIVERGSTLHIKLVILEDKELSPIDLTQYPPQSEAQAADAAPQESAIQLEDEATLVHNRMMNATRPRDMADGVGMGLKAAGAGVICGAGSLVAFPAMGASEDGVPGFFTGLVKGVATMVGCTVGGAAVCATQVVRGVMNTPEAIMQVQAGKRWDAEEGMWVDDSTNLRREVQSLGKEAKELDSDDDAPQVNADGGQPSSRRVADTTYYDIIGVPAHASPVQIKQAYYKAALRVHPDKNPGDPQASKRFQDLAQAYQVLSDPKLRERYDHMGKEAVMEGALPSIDATLFFSMLFGAEQFEKYIGKLYLAMQTDHITKDLQKEVQRRQRLEADDDGSLEGSLNDELHNWKKDLQLRRQQLRREVLCAKNVAERLDQWVYGRDEAGFVLSVSQEAAELVNVSFGGRLLRTIGLVYESCAVQWLTSLHGYFTVDSHLASWNESLHTFQVRASASWSVVQSVIAAKGMRDKMPDNPEEDQDAARSIEESLPVFLQTIWDVSAIDIETTSRTVCEKILKDISVPWQIRYRRAFALLRLGRIFRDVGQVENSDISQAQVAKQHLEEAFYNAVREKGEKGG